MIMMTIHDAVDADVTATATVGVRSMFRIKCLDRDII